MPRVTSRASPSDIPTPNPIFKSIDEPLIDEPLPSLGLTPGDSDWVGVVKRELFFARKPVVEIGELGSFCPPKNIAIAYMDIVVVRLPSGAGTVVGVQSPDAINVPFVCVLAQVTPSKPP